MFCIAEKFADMMDLTKPLAEEHWLDRPKQKQGEHPSGL